MSHSIFSTSPSFLQFPNYKQLLSHHSALSSRTDFEASGFSPGILAGKKLHYLFWLWSVSPSILSVHNFLFLPVFLLFFISSHSSDSPIDQMTF